MDQHHCELRVLLGPQAGSRLALSSGEYLLGTSDECTIILSGPHVNECHLTLVVSETGISVRPEQGLVRDAAGRELMADTLVEIGAPLDIGGVWIAVDDPSAEWPLPEALSRLGTTSEVTAPGAANESGEPTAASVSEVVDVPSSAPVGSGHRPIRPATAAMAVALALAIACVAFGLHALWASLEPLPSGAAAQAIAPAASAPTATVTAMLNEMSVADMLKATQHDDGSWSVTGYLPTAEARSSVMKQLAKLDPRPEITIYADDEVLAAAIELLIAQPFGTDAQLHLEQIGAGRLRLSGAARDETIVDAASFAILHGVPGLHSVEASSVLLPDALLAELKRRLSATGLDAQMNVLAERPQVVLGGVVDENGLARWQSLQTAFRDQYADALPIRTAFTHPVPKLPFEVKTVVGGPVPYVMTSTGEHVSRGGQIAGLRLSNIDDTQVVFDGKQRLQLSR